jgi:hypothetical protein
MHSPGPNRDIPAIIALMSMYNLKSFILSSSFSRQDLKRFWQSGLSILYGMNFRQFSVID